MTLQLINAFQQLPVLHSRLKETKAEKRVEVVKYYMVYLQVDQAVKIAAWQMQIAKQSDSPAEQLPQPVATRQLQPTP